MNNELNISKNISRDGFLVLPSVQTAKFISKLHSIYSLTGIDVFYVAFNPLSTLSDYIGFKY